MLCILLQVELAHHYHESVKCRETLAAVSQIERGPALIESSHSFGGEFHCLPCGYSSEVSQHYQRHLKSLKHQRSVAESRGLLTTSNTEPGAMVVQQAAVKVEDQTIKVELEEEPSSTGLYQCLPCEYGTPPQKKYGIFWEFFPKGGGGVSSIPKTFGKFTKLKMALKTP